MVLRARCASILRKGVENARALGAHGYVVVMRDA
jgi:hypothetical protein